MPEGSAPQVSPLSPGREKIAEALHAMVRGAIGTAGEPFFQSLSLTLARILEVKYAMVALIEPERDRTARILGWCCDGKTQENLSYSLIGTPCYRVSDGEICYYPRDLQQLFPEDAMLGELGLQSYMGIPLQDGDGRVLGIMSVFSDRPLEEQEYYLNIFQIFAVRAAAELERHQTETALRRSEERYALAASGSSGGVWDWDIESGGVYYSPRFLELLGYSMEEFPSLFYAWEQKIHAEDLPQVRGELENHLLRHQPFRVEYRLLAKSGQYRWFESRGQALWKESGEPHRMAGSILDIHERKQVEERVHRLSRLHAVASGINEAIVRIRDPQKLYEAACRIAVEEGALRMAWVGLLDVATATLRPVASAGRDDGFTELVALSAQDVPAGPGPAGRALRTGQFAVCNLIAEDASFPSSDFAMLHGYRSCAVFPLKPEDQIVGAILVYADEEGYFQSEELRVLNALAENLSFAIESGERDRERQRLQSQSLRAQRMESIGTLAGGIAHDLNNVLTPITIALSVLRLRLSHPKDIDLVNTLETSVNRGASMVSQIVSFARGVEGQSVLLRPKDVVKDIERMVMETFPKDITFTVAYSADVWMIEGDPTQLHQVLLNLCVNARDAMLGGGALKLAVRNEFVGRAHAAMNPGIEPGPMVVFEVSDTGSGIPEGIRDRIFDPFFTTKEVGRGTGLGLSTSLGIIKSHAGFVEMDTETGKGTTFRVYIPAKTAVVSAAPAPAIVDDRHGNGELIMVVDDESSILTTTSHTLEAFGYRVITARDGAEAIALITTNDEGPAVVLTDMMMPVMDGPSMIRALRKIRPAQRIIAASGRSSQFNIHGANLGVRYFLQKPYTSKELLGTLSELLQQTPNGQS
jgi:PAS domain S-box-containing protein